MILIDHSSTFSQVFEFFEGLVSIASAYFYAYVSIFGLSVSRYLAGDGGEKTSQSPDDKIDMFCFVFFLVAIGKNFLTDFKPIGAIEPIRDLASIAQRYVWGEFPMDFIMLFPFHWISNIELHRLGNFIFFLKVYRLKRAEDLISIRKVTKFLQQYLRNRADLMA